jgi:hypothetical protein
MSKPWANMPQQRTQQIQVQVDLKQDAVICPDCDGIGLIMQGAFMPKYNAAAIGTDPQLVAVPVVLCNQCGKRLMPPFQTAASVKEA